MGAQVHSLLELLVKDLVGNQGPLTTMLGCMWRDRRGSTAMCPSPYRKCP